MRCSLNSICSMSTNVLAEREPTAAQPSQVHSPPAVRYNTPLPHVLQMPIISRGAGGRRGKSEKGSSGA